MYNNSTQRKFWLYDSQELEYLRLKANKDYKERRSDEDLNFLTCKEEFFYIKHNLSILKDVCRKFKPPMLKSVVGTAFQYFKRFYLNNSCMEYPPKNIAVTCAYLACKVEEFNISIDQFVSNLKGDSVRAAEIVLSNEFLLMQKLKYHLTVHNPYRAIKGFMIDIKTRSGIDGEKVEQLRQIIDEYLDRVMFTDACFLFSPSQIALASILYGATKCNVNLEPYLSTVLFEGDPSRLFEIRQVSETINGLLLTLESPTKDTIKSIDKKLKPIHHREESEACQADEQQAGE